MLSKQNIPRVCCVTPWPYIKSEPGIGSFDSSLNSTLAARSHLVKSKLEARSSRLSTSKQFYVKVSMENVALIYYLGYLPRIQASRHA